MSFSFYSMTLSHSFPRVAILLYDFFSSLCFYSGLFGRKVRYNWLLDEIFGLFWVAGKLLLMNGVGFLGIDHLGWIIRLNWIFFNEFYELSSQFDRYLGNLNWGLFLPSGIWWCYAGSYPGFFGECFLKHDLFLDIFTNYDIFCVRLVLLSKKGGLTPEKPLGPVARYTLGVIPSNRPLDTSCGRG